MDVSAAGTIPISLESVLAAKQGQVAAEAGVSVLKKGLDLQKELMNQLFQEMGIGRALDVQA